jgi:hypothetical protein
MRAGQSRGGPLARPGYARAMSARLEAYEGAPELTGHVVYETDWYLLAVPAEAHAALVALLDPLGVAVKPAARPHISVMKDEAPCRNKPDWGTAFAGEPVTFRYSPIVRDENGLHLWVDCHSGRLCEMREHFGLATLRRDDGAYLVNFHLTVGRRKKAVPRRHRPQLRLTPQSHIDAETGMQHL